MSDIEKNDKNLKGESKKFFESDAGDGTLREEQYLSGYPLVLCVSALLTCMFLFSLDQTIVAPATTVIANEFGGFDQIGWLTSAFLLPVVVLCVFWGRMSIVLGRKYTMILGMAFFLVGSIICAVAKNMNTLIGGRAVAGIGGGAVQTVGFIIINEIVPIDKRSLVFASSGATYSIASVLGPVVGGGLVSGASWRWCFYINLPIGAVAVVFFYFSFNPPRPKNNIKQSLLAIDYLGTLLLAAGVSLFLLGLTFGSEVQYQWSSAVVIACLVVGIVVTIVFFIWNFVFSKNPILDINVVKVPQIQAAAVGFGFMFAYYLSLVLFLSIYFQNIKGRSAIGTGVSLFAFIVPLILTTTITPILINHTRYIKPYAIVAGVTSVVGCGILLLLGVDSTEAQTIGYLIIAGIGAGVGYPANNMGGQIKAPKTVGGTISTATYLIFVRISGSTIGTIVSNVVYNVSLQHQVKTAIPKLTNEKLIKEFAKYDLDTLATSTQILKELSPEAVHFIRTLMMKSIKNFFYTCVGYAAVYFITTLLMTNMRIPLRSEIQERDLTAKNESTTESREETRSLQGSDE